MDQTPYGEQPPPIPPGPDQGQGTPPPGHPGVTAGSMMLPEAPGATAGLVLGICSIVFSFPLIGLVLAWIGFTKSRDAKTICEMDPNAYSNYGIAQAGYICSIVGLCLGGLFTLCGCGYFILIIGMIASGSMP